MLTPGQIRQAAHPARSRPLLKFAEHGRGWWFDGDHFFRSRREAEEQGPAIAPGSAEASHILGAICRRLFKINRWQGESGPHGCVSVGAHSLLVATIAGCLADVRGDVFDRRICYRAGAVHDLGEALGMGDPASPWVRGFAEIREQAERHQRAVERLLGFGSHGAGVRSIVKDADHLAAAIERRVIFGDDSREMESPGMDELEKEAGFGGNLSGLAFEWLGNCDAVNLLTAISPPT